MRTRAIHIAVLPNADRGFSISFRYTDKKKAQAVVRMLIEKLTLAFEPGQIAQNL